MKRIIISLLVVLLLPAISYSALPGFMLERMGTMSGQIFVDGEPVADSMVAFFLESKGLPPMPGQATRIPEFLTRASNDGRFAIRLAKGKYYMGILVRDAADGPGPPRPGEKYYFATTEDGGLRLLEIDNKQILDIGRVEATLPDKFAGLAGAEAGQTLDTASESFLVQGMVVNAQGAPFNGAIVLGKQDLNSPRPEFISNRTAEDGQFSLQLPAGMHFYLIARETIAGARPMPGQSLGTYGIISETGMASPVIFGVGSPPPGVLDENKNSNDRALTITGAQGETVSGITINMYTVPDPQSIKASIQGTPGSPKFETGANLNNIFFASDSHQLDRRSYNELERWSIFLKGMQGISVEISGHTDSSGPEEHNLTLSTQRAQAVAEFLISQGVPSERISAKGYGEERPKADNDTEAGKSLNRRVEIQFQ